MNETWRWVAAGMVLVLAIGIPVARRWLSRVRPEDDPYEVLTR